MAPACKLSRSGRFSPQEVADANGLSHLGGCRTRAFCSSKRRSNSFAAPVLSLRSTGVPPCSLRSQGLHYIKDSKCLLAAQAPLAKIDIRSKTCRPRPTKKVTVKKSPAASCGTFKTAKSICRFRIITSLPLSPLEAFARPFLSVFLALLGAGVARKIALFAQDVL